MNIHTRPLRFYIGASIILATSLSACTGQETSFLVDNEEVVRQLPLNKPEEISMEIFPGGLRLASFDKDPVGRFQSLIYGKPALIPGGCIGLELPDGHKVLAIWPTGTKIDESAARNGQLKMIGFNDQEFSADGVVREYTSSDDDIFVEENCGLKEIAFLTERI